MIDPKEVKAFAEKEMQENIIPALEDFIRIENTSRNFDSEWNTNGLLMRTAEFVKNWMLKQGVEGLKVDIIKDEDKSPLIFAEVPGEDPPVLFYSHFDKQPEMQGWAEGLHPRKPVIKDGRLYGRGGADDGYAAFMCMAMLKFLQSKKVKLPRVIVLVEGDQESGSAHLMPYIDKLKGRIGTPRACFCMDSGTLDYEHLWVTTALRGAVIFEVEVRVTEEGIHSGSGSGVIPSPERIMRMLISRLEDERTGTVVEDLQVPIDPVRYQELYELSEQAGQSIIENMFPMLPGVKRAAEKPFDLLLNRSQKAQLTIIGVTGLPQAEVAGNIVVPGIKYRLSLRLCPTADPAVIKERLVALLTKDPPYNAKVTVDVKGAMGGWNSPKISAELQGLLKGASSTYFEKPMMCVQEGGSIPLMGILQKLFPDSELVVTGVLGPQSNAHAANEFLHIPFTKKLLCCMIEVLGKLGK